MTMAVIATRQKKRESTKQLMSSCLMSISGERESCENENQREKKTPGINTRSYKYLLGRDERKKSTREGKLRRNESEASDAQTAITKSSHVNGHEPRCSFAFESHEIETNANIPIKQNIWF